MACQLQSRTSSIPKVGELQARYAESYLLMPTDMPTAHGSPIYKDHLVKVDAGSVSILRNAGCLIFGKSVKSPGTIVLITARQNHND
jgi:hypothetical protein